MTESTERAAFEADAAPMGFDLTRQSIAVPEPWAEYGDEHTGHRWAGWLARASLAEGKAEPAPDDRRLFDAIVWALGAHETDGFRESYAGDGPYWWRAELAQRAGLVWDGEKYVAALSPPSMDGAVQAATSGGER